MVKKILTLVLTLIIINSVLVFGSEEFYFEPSEYKETVEFLESLGIFNDTDLMSTTKSTTITRGEFSLLVLSCINMKNSAEASEFTQKFNDVTETHPYGLYINTAYDMGLLNGQANNNFNPDLNITTNEAIKIVVNMLGYEEKAVAKGGYPSGYLNVATSLGLSENLSFSSSLLRGDALKLIENALTTPIMIKNINTYEVYKDQNILTRYFDIKKGTGLVTCDEYCTITQDKIIKSGNIIVDGIEYYSNTEKTKNIVGKNIEFYYKIKDDINTIITLKEKNNKIVILKDIISYNNGYIVLNNDKEVKYKTSITSKIVYNNELLQEFAPDIMVPVCGSVRLIDNNNDNIYDVIFIDEYYNLVVDRVDISNEIITDIKGGLTPNGRFSRNIKISDYEKVILKDNMGTQITLSDLKQNDVLIVYKSTKTLTATVISQTIVGKITQINEENQVEIDNIFYDLSHDLRFSQNEISLNTDYMFYLNSLGEIVARKMSNFSNTAYILDIKSKKDINDTVQFKILDMGGKVIIYDVAAKIEIRDCSSNNKINSSSMLNDSDTYKNKLVQYELNANDEINKITLPLTVSTSNEIENAVGYPLVKADYLINEWPAHLLSGEGDGRKSTYKTATQFLSNWIYLGNTTNIAFVPEIGATNYNDDDLSVKKASTIFNDDQKILLNKIQLYKTDINSLNTDYIVYNEVMKGDISDDNYLSLVTDITTVSNEKTGEATYKLELLTGGNVQSFLTKDFSIVSDISLCKGDLIRYQTDSKANINQIQRYYNYKQDKVQGQIGWNDRSRVIGGIATKISDNLIQIRLDGKTDTECFNMSKGKIIIYNSKNQKVSFGTAKDFQVDDRIIIYSRYGETRSYIIYK